MVYAKVALALLLTISSLHASASDALLPHKDALFNYPPLLSTKDNGDFVELEFIELRDVNGRDEIPVHKAKAEYVEVSSQTQPRDKLFKHRNATIETFEVGLAQNAKFAVIFIHGAGGTKELGVKDFTFGGNFNRLKNLAIKNGGVYYSPTVSFDQQGLDGVTEIIHSLKLNTPNIKTVIACGSAGSFICWSLLNNSKVTKQLAGVIILGGAIAPPSSLLKQAITVNLPIVIAHGTRDAVLNWQQMYSGYESLKQYSNQYPARFILYRNGGHGTPIRMIDWRSTLNWLLSRS